MVSLLRRCPYISCVLCRCHWEKIFIIYYYIIIIINYYIIIIIIHLLHHHYNLPHPADQAPTCTSPTKGGRLGVELSKSMSALVVDEETAFDQQGLGAWRWQGGRWGVLWAAGQFFTCSSAEQRGREISSRLCHEAILRFQLVTCNRIFIVQMRRYVRGTVWTELQEACMFEDMKSVRKGGQSTGGRCMWIETRGFGERAGVGGK